MNSTELFALFHTDLLGKLFLSALLGGLIGLERELNSKAAGLRTNLMICVGATLFMHLSLLMATLGGQSGDPGRIAAQIVSGISWVSAGTILQARGSVTGLTTAATLWVVAGIGMSAGAGAIVPAIGTTAFVLFILIPVGWWERRYGRQLREVAAREGRARVRRSGKRRPKPTREEANEEE